MRKIGCLFFFLIILFGIGAGLYFYRFYNDAVSSPNSGSSEKKVITIDNNQSLDQINKTLVNEGIIKDTKFPNGYSVFKVYSVVNKLDSKYQAGTYFLSQNMSLKEVTDSLQHSKDTQITITIKEGLRIEEIAESINVSLNDSSNVKLSKFNKVDFIKQAKDYTGTKYEFLNTRPKDVSTLEGYLYPDTYFVSRNIDTSSVIDLLLKTFSMKVYEPNKSQINNNKYTLHQLLTLASIIEREVRNDDDRMLVADLFFRRLNNASLGNVLGSDATLLYVLGNEKDGWWKTQLSLNDLNNNPSPYNTRINPGLPPTPIDSPSLSSFRAVLQPKSNDYVYFVNGDDGKTYFSKTFAEHSDNINRYCKIQCR